MKSKPVSNAGELTREALLAMPESEYMNPRQLSFFKALLQKTATDLTAAEAATRETLRQTEAAADPADRASNEEVHSIEILARERDIKLYQRVLQALTRIESGDYGWCEETGEPIGVARLLVQPTATTCVDVQQRRELRNRMYA
jgi:DnaK suppressor protein